jgi:hypothetical protein
MKAYWEWRYGSTYCLTSALDGGDWSISRGRRDGEEKISHPRRESNLRTPIVQPKSRYLDNDKSCEGNIMLKVLQCQNVIKNIIPV